MKLILILLSIAFMLAVALNCPGAEWLTDYAAATHKAQHEGKAILLDFTGSDWCGWCMKLKREVFDQTEFDAFARANLVLVEVDFPRHKSQAAEEKAQNENLARRYGIRGYPTIIVLNSSGEQIGQTGYHDGGPGAFIGELKRMRGMPKNAPEIPAIKPAVPIHYGQLALKGISGPANSRMALINNETFLVGDSAKVKVNDAKVQVTCKEIREDSVLIIADGKTVELKLAHH